MLLCNGNALPSDRYGINHIKQTPKPNRKACIRTHVVNIIILTTLDRLQISGKDCFILKTAVKPAKHLN